jgi:cytochrome c5
VRVKQADGTGAVAVTCSTCHEAPRNGALVRGLPNASLRLGQAILDAAAGTDPSYAAAVSAWGPGRLDVTTAQGNEPVRIADLRPVRWLTHLQADATVAQRDRTALAIRIETLVVTSHAMLVRPPRMISLALAAYVASLAERLPGADEAAQASPSGARLFASACQACHQAGSLTGPPVRLDVVGTDPAQGLSRSRGTGTYRVPSLHGVGTRGPLLHDGTVPSVAVLLDPSRLTAGYPQRLHGAGAIPGHTFGLDLSAGDRAALVAYVEAL